MLASSEDQSAAAIGGKPLRIAHVLPSFGIGGQERVALDLARAYRARGHHVVAYGLVDVPGGGLLGDFRRDGVEAQVVERRLRLDPFLVLRLAARMRRDRVDVVHTHNPLALTYGAPAGKLARAAVVHTKHGENLEPNSRRLVVRRVAARWADAFVAVSATTAAAARASRDVDEAKLQVIPNGIDLSRFRLDPAARATSRRALGIPAGAWVVGTVGRLAPEKNQRLLVEALKGALGEDARLVLVGDGPEREALARAAGEAGLARWVTFPGARSDVPALLAALDVFALPSLTEGLPLVVLEAMATGLPVVASRVGGLPDVVIEGETGFLVPPGDPAALRAALLGLAADRDTARRVGARGRAEALRHHSLEGMSDAYLRIYRQLIGRGAP